MADSVECAAGESGREETISPDQSRVSLIASRCAMKMKAGVESNLGVGVGGARWRERDRQI